LAEDRVAERSLGDISSSFRRPSVLLRPLTKFIRRQPLGAAGGVILLVCVIIAIIAGAIAPKDSQETHLMERYGPPGHMIGEERFLLGTDQLGRDILSRMLLGSRISLYVSLISVGIGVTLGAVLGIVSGYVGGMVDLLFQRVVDAFMSFPALVFALGVMAVLGPSLNNVILTLCIIFIPGSARIVRSEVLSVKERVYVDAARAIGAPNWRIMIRHIMPNCMAPYIVFATANLGFAIVIEAALSFLGVGTPPDVPSWGGMLSVAGQKYVEVSPWLMVFPCFAISVVVFGFNLFGDAIRDILDPRLRGSLAGGA
jgi:peptide/nickel transport system permease protein